MASPMLERIARAVDRSAARIDRFLTTERLRLYPSTFLCITTLVMLAIATVGVTRPTLLPQGFSPDFLAHWTGGHMVLHDSGRLYDPASQGAVQHNEARSGSFSWFVSPPFVAALYLPLALLPFRFAALVWLAISVLALLVSFRLLKEWAPRLFGRSGVTVFVGLASIEPIFELLGSGQDSALILLLLISGTGALARGRVVLGGTILGLAVLKPQLVLFVPVVLLVRREWRGLAAFSATALAACTASVAMVGVDGVNDWVHALTSDRYSAAVTAGQAWKMASLPALVHYFVPGLGDAASVIALIAALVCVVWAACRGSDHAAWSVALLMTVASSPHLVVYDLVVAIPAVVWLLEVTDASRAARLRACLAITYVLLWTVSVRHVLAGHAGFGWLGAPWQAIPIALLATSALRRSLTSGGTT